MKYSLSGIILAGIVTLFSGSFAFVSNGYATHAAAGNCKHEHFDRTHSSCLKARGPGGVNKTCTVGTKVGICRQTSSQCNCRVQTSRLNFFNFNKGLSPLQLNNQPPMDRWNNPRVDQRNAPLYRKNTPVYRWNNPSYDNRAGSSLPGWQYR